MKAGKKKERVEERIINLNIKKLVEIFEYNLEVSLVIQAHKLHDR